ncbi:Uncharacterized protein Fot_53021 [Forsythia ovata]|uniref:Uncharacterized protein n=1 Tax=Forsythia ovata TaxID=205694 RepID=A0ABD1PHI4_9LAMI
MLQAHISVFDTCEDVKEGVRECVQLACLKLSPWLKSEHWREFGDKFFPWRILRIEEFWDRFEQPVEEGKCSQCWKTLGFSHSDHVPRTRRKSKDTPASPLGNECFSRVHLSNA